MTVHQTEPMPIRILLVDDHPGVRQGLALLLAPQGIMVSGEAGNRLEALACLKQHPADLALLDISLDGEDGLALISELSALGLPSLVYSMYGDGRHVEEAFANGALGYVTKKEIHRVLVEAIREVTSGRRFVSPVAAAALAANVTNHDGARRELSDQERQVFQLLGQGEGTIEIAAALNLSTRTVESYYLRIQDKFGLHGMRDLRRHAILHRQESK